MTRNAPVVARLLFAACTTAGLAACDGDGQPAAGSDRAPVQTGGSTQASLPTTPTGSGSAAGCPGPGSAPVDPGSVLVPGPTNGMPRSDAGGEKLVIDAVVLDAGCGPLVDATVTIWHTDTRGRYGPSTGDCCYYGGVVRSDRNGRLRLESIRPGQYPEPGAPPAHIHVEVEHASGRLETEIVFAATPGPNVVPVTLESISPQQGDRYWYGQAVLMLDR